MKIVSVEEMQALEQASVGAGVSLDTLMENAGLAVAEAVREMCEAEGNGPVMVLIGPGNNGGDGLVAARHLASWGIPVTAYLCTQRRTPDPKLDMAKAAGVRVTSAGDDTGYEDLRSLASNALVVVDAVLGTGRARPIEPPLRDVLTTAREGLEAAEHRPTVVAVDLPTGMNADTGHMDPACIPADLTLVLGRPKLGFFLNPAFENTPWRIVDIGIPDGLDTRIPVEQLTDEFAVAVLPPRRPRSNKGTYGRALVVAGSESYVGAAYLTCAAAGRAGAGLVTLATPDTVYPMIAGRLAESTYVPLVERGRGVIDSGFAAVQVTDSAQRATSMLVGPGLGQAPATVDFVRVLLLDRREGPRLVLDADCLNSLVDVDNWWSRIRGPAILTPHPGEMARLLGTSVDSVERDRLHTARVAAEKWQHVVVLKGACTVVAHPDGRARISPSVNAGMATGGTGDVLAGLIAGLLAQGVAPFDAASAGVHIHGMAGDLTRERLGEAAMVAGDLLSDIPPAMRGLESLRGHMGRAGLVGDVHDE